MKNFIEHIQKSIYGPQYYRELLTRPASHSWKYYGSLAMLLAVLMTIATSLPLIPRLNQFLKTLPEQALSYFPNELRVDISNGRVSTNAPEPYFVNFPASSTLSESSTTPVLHFLTIDTKTNVTLEQFNSYNTTLWLSRDAIIALNQDNQLNITGLGDLNGVIDAPHLRLWMSRVESYFPLLTPMLVLIIFLGMLLSFLAMLGYLLLDAVLVYLLGKILKQQWSYRDAYHISLHAITLPLLVSSIFFLLPVSGIELPFLSTIILLVVVYVNYKNTVYEKGI